MPNELLGINLLEAGKPLKVNLRKGGREVTTMAFSSLDEKAPASAAYCRGLASQVSLAKLSINHKRLEHGLTRHAL